MAGRWLSATSGSFRKYCDPQGRRQEVLPPLFLPLWEPGRNDPLAGQGEDTSRKKGNIIENRWLDNPDVYLYYNVYQRARLRFVRGRLLRRGGCAGFCDSPPNTMLPLCPLRVWSDTGPEPPHRSPDNMEGIWSGIRRRGVSYAFTKLCERAHGLTGNGMPTRVDLSVCLSAR